MYCIGNGGNLIAFRIEPVKGNGRIGRQIMRRVIALVGRPNVGKSTLFNRLTQRRDALVADAPGLTRDRRYGAAEIGDRPCTLIDTGGLFEKRRWAD